MFWIVDIIIVLIFALFIFFGYTRGLTGSVLKILSFFIALVIAFVLFKPISNFIIDNTLIDEKIQESIVSIVEKDSNEEGKIEEEETTLPQSMIDYINKSVSNAANDAKKTVVENTSRDIAIVIVNIGSAILVFLIARIILLFVKGIADFLTELPIIKQLDKTGGVIYGILESLIIVFIIFAIFTLISPLIEGTGILTIINKSFIGGFLYNNNLLLKIIF